LFIRDYTEKQWGRPASELSAVFAPKRIDLRDDGDTRLFRDQPQGWLRGEDLISRQLRNCVVQLGTRMSVKTLPYADAYVVTAPLDDFVLGARTLEWRGVGFVHEFIPGEDKAFSTAVTNYPTTGTKYTRVTEPKHMTGETGDGTVLSWEYSGTPDRFYPVNDREGMNRGQQRWLEDELRKEVPNAVVAGRLGKYVYIDMDQAIMQGINAAREVMRRSG
jgi:UDP-galactopyranose mutase